MKLEIGGGSIPRQGYAQLDLHHGEGDMRRLVQDGIPLPDASVETVFASHVLEHIPAGQPRFATFNEIHRVLLPGGTFEIVVPCAGFTDHEHGGVAVHAGWQAYSDPDHQSLFWFPESFWYFTGKFAANADYGLSLWDEGPMELVDGWEARVTLVKPS